MTTLLDTSPALLYILAGLLGLTVGSFLNVVIHRLPIMLERRWQADCRALLEDATEPPSQAPFNLALPASTCPHCGHRLKLWENIPLFSYLLLRGRCSACGAAISLQYPFVEGLTAVLSIIVVTQLGVGWPALLALLLTWTLIALAAIDLKTQLLPDDLTLPLIWMGLLVNLNGMYTDYASALWGAVGGYLSLRLVYHLFKLLTGKEGMGFGDFKLLAAIGAWGGWQILPATILISSLLGALVGLSLIALRRHQQGIPIPFGPFLAAAGWITLLWGAPINQLYLQYSGLA